MRETMRYLSLCSGIEAATVAWHPLGWEPVAFAEIEPFPSAVLAHHYPSVPNLGDMTRYREWNLGRIDLLVGGTPCQAFSVAGQRGGLDDERGNLALTFCHIADHFDPEYVLWENVPGVLSDKTNAFGCLLAGLAGLDEPLETETETEKGKWPGNGLVVGGRRRVAWVTLDAQYFGVPQRRRRVFVLAVDAETVRRAPERCPAQILSIGQSLRRDTPKGREKGQGSAGGVARSLTRRYDSSEDGTGTGTGRGLELVAAGPAEVAPTLNATFADKQGLEDQHINGGAGCFVPHPIAFNNRQDPVVSGNLAQPLGAKDNGGGVMTLAIPATTGARETDIHTSLRSRTPGASEASTTTVVKSQMQVRRLTPTEAARLQGFPDDYLDISFRNKPAADGPKYKALGNSMAVPVMRWIGQRIQEATQ